MFVEIRPYENQMLSVYFKAEGENFSKVLQAVKKVPGRAWVPEKRLWTIPADRDSCDILLINLYDNGICRDYSGSIEQNHAIYDFAPLDTKTAVESNKPDSLQLRDILSKLEEVIAVKHYSKRTKEAYSYWISRFVHENKDRNFKTLSDTDNYKEFIRVPGIAVENWVSGKV